MIYYGKEIKGREYMRKRIAGKNSPHSGTTGKTAIRKQGGSALSV